jgi:hypothetical protein
MSLARSLLCAVAASVASAAFAGAAFAAEFNSNQVIVESYAGQADGVQPGGCDVAYYGPATCGRTVIQQYAGNNPHPVAQSSATYQPYAPPVFLRVK